METIKIIDLLNMIANGEKVPKKIHIKQFQCDFIFNGHTYLSDEEKQQNIYWCLHSDALNYEVEIIEEKKQIKKLDCFDLCKSNEDGDLELTYTGVADTFDEVYEKINELIDTVNEMRKEK